MTSTLTSPLPPLQFKGEVMDFDVDFDGDHRKRRRNRTTQSCLNCHTSKRKCDRKRPCQRCIQLGLTGLCVYEVDDMTSRDDPTVDESTRLRSRIAELESLVRELRGKPHPKWADAGFCDGDPNEKWHSRSSRRVGGTPNGSSIMRDGPSTDASQQLYRFSSNNSSPYSTSGHVLTPTFSRGRHEQCSPTDEVAYTTSSSPASTVGYGEPHHSESSGNVSPNGHYHPHSFNRGVPVGHSHVHSSSCSCLSNPAAGHPLIALTNQLRNALSMLRQLPEHNTHAQPCTVLKRMAELDDLLHGNTGTISTGGYDGIPTPPEGELLSPISTSSHSGMGHSLQDWSSMSNAGGYEYFSVPSGEHAAYPKTYQMH